ncbi:MAG: hypothetical protein JST16_08735 [Bdellovibrionales bacterium]|nr:hypothetical protein [Bdellovibrionales bacterium]
MSRLDFLRQKEPRTRWMASLFALCVLASLPSPAHAMRSVLTTALLGLWVSVGLLAWSAWFRPAYAPLAWFSALFLAFMAAQLGAGGFPLFLLLCWGLWLRLRRSRDVKSSQIIFALLTSLVCAGSVHAATKSKANKTKAAAKPSTGKPSSGLAEPEPTVSDVNVPKYLTGYQLNDLASCGAANQIPWRFRPDRRKTRLLLRDHLRLNTETHFETWEIHQVMDGQGYVTYVFSKIQNGRRVESILIKDNVYNRIVETNGKPKVVEVQDLRTLINRSVVAFVHADGSTVNFAPGLAGQSILTIELRQAVGRPLAPLYIRGSYCERAQAESNAPDSEATPPASGTKTGT